MCNSTDSLLITRLSQSLAGAISALGHLLINLEGCSPAPPQSPPPESGSHLLRYSSSSSSSSSLGSNITDDSLESALPPSVRALQPLDPALFRRGYGSRRRAIAIPRKVQRSRRNTGSVNIAAPNQQSVLPRAKSAPASPSQSNFSSSDETSVSACSPKRVRFAMDV